MRVHRFLQRCAVAMSVLGLMMGQLAHAAGPVTANRGTTVASTSVLDIALQQDGVLRGQLTNVQGAGEANQQVALVKDGQTIANSKTDAKGNFALQGVEAGVYELQTATSRNVCRVWAPNTAPPSAKQAALLVSGSDIVRGEIAGLLANPWVLGAIVAVAIAVPLALDDDDAS